MSIHCNGQALCYVKLHGYSLNNKESQVLLPGGHSIQYFSKMYTFYRI